MSDRLFNNACVNHKCQKCVHSANIVTALVLKSTPKISRGVALRTGVWLCMTSTSSRLVVQVSWLITDFCTDFEHVDGAVKEARKHSLGQFRKQQRWCFEHQDVSTNCKRCKLIVCYMSRQFQCFGVSRHWYLPGWRIVANVQCVMCCQLVWQCSLFNTFHDAWQSWHVRGTACATHERENKRSLIETHWITPYICTATVCSFLLSNFKKSTAQWPEAQINTSKHIHNHALDRQCPQRITDIWFCQMSQRNYPASKATILGAQCNEMFYCAFPSDLTNDPLINATLHCHQAGMPKRKTMWMTTSPSFDSMRPFTSPALEKLLAQGIIRLRELSRCLENLQHYARYQHTDGQEDGSLQIQ